jgi:TonB family protein
LTISAPIYQIVPVRFLTLSLVTAIIAAAHQTLADQTPPPHVGVRSGSVMSPGKMQAMIQATISKSSQYDVPPKFIVGDAPVYPPSRRKLKESGYALIEFTVDERGHTRDFRMVKTTYLYFANHGILAIQNWRFQPAKKNGQPVPCRIRIPFTYRCD